MAFSRLDFISLTIIILFGKKQHR